MLEPTLRKVVKEEMELFFNLQSIPRRSLALQPNTIPTRNLQLIFANKLPSILFTNSKVEDEDHDPLKIQLVDAVSQCVIDHGSLSGIKIEIVVLNGDFVADGREDWSENEFNDNIVREREGKRPLLVGDLSFVLVGGVGYIQNITFTDNSSWLRSRKFRLGVRVVSRASLGTGIREAVSEAFMVLDHRGESYQKHHTPSLDDPIWRLKKISKQGASHKKLESKGIKTVKDFLMQYYLDPLSLRQVLGKGVANKTWETMVKHANECHLDNTFYSYQVSGVQLLFNCVYKIVAVKFEGQDYRSVSTLDTSQKALVKMYKQSAFYNLDQLVPVQNPFATSTPVPPTIEQNTSFSSSKLDFQHDALSIVDQGNVSLCKNGWGYLKDKDLHTSPLPHSSMLSRDNFLDNQPVSPLVWTNPRGTHELGPTNPRVMSVDLYKTHDAFHSFTKPYGLSRFTHQVLYTSLQPTFLAIWDLPHM